MHAGSAPRCHRLLIVLASSQSRFIYGSCDCVQLSFKVKVVCPMRQCMQNRFETDGIWSVYTGHVHQEQLDDHLNIAI